MHIALIDDDPDYHQLIEEELQAAGIEYSLASWYRAEQAIRAIPSARPADLYIVDWRFIGERDTGLIVIQAIFTANPGARIVLSTHIQSVDLEPELMAMVTGGQVSMLEKYTNERQALCTLLKPANQPAKILVLDDDPDDAWLIGEAISSGSNGVLEPVIVNNSSDARAALKEADMGGFVVDYRLQQEESGVDFISSLSKAQRQKPTVLVTGLDQTRFDTRTVRLLASGSFFMLHKSDAKPKQLSRCLGYRPDSESATAV